MMKICGRALRVALAALVLVAAGTTQGSGVSTTLIVPIVQSSQGLGGSFNVSEMTLTNRGMTDAAVTFSYTAAFGGGGGTATDILPAGRQKIVPDALAYLRSLSAAIVPETGDRGGTLRVTFSGLAAEGDAAITVRTTSPSGNGRAGVAYKGIPTSKLLTGTAYLCGLRQDGTDRSNLAVLNAGTTSDGNVTLRLTVISGGPASPGRYPLPDVTLAPGGFQQLSGILGMVGAGAAGGNVTNGYVQIERVGGTAPYWAYAVINDQVTSDGSIVSRVTASTLSGVLNLAVPVIVETASYESELILANVGERARSLQFTYAAGALQGGTASFTVDLGPSEQKIIPDLVQYLRAKGTAGIGPSGPDVVGTLFASVTAGDAASLFLGARTSTRGAGRYGVFYEATPVGSGSTSQAWLYGLQQNRETRTNLALVNTSDPGEAPETLRVELFDGETGAKVATIEGDATTVSARGFTQLGSALGTYAPGTANGYARITRTVGNGPFLTYAVVNDGGKPGERTGDGAFVEMQEEGATPTLDFSLSVAQPPAIQAGASGTTAVSVTRTGGHTAAIVLSLTANAQGITGSGSIASGAGSGTLTIVVPSSVAPGSYALTLSGSDGSLAARTAPFSVTVTGTAAQHPVYIQIQLHIDPFANGDPDSRYSDERTNIPIFLSALESHGAKASVLPSHHFAQRAFDTNDTILRDVENRGHQVATHTHLAKADAASKWKWSLVIGPDVTPWLNSDGYYQSVSTLKGLLAPQISRNTHITGFSQDDAQRTKLFDLTERLGFLTSAGGYASNDYDYPHYAYHPKSGVDYREECSDRSVRQLYFHHVGPAIEDNDLDRIKNDFLDTLNKAAGSPGNSFVHGFAIHNNALFVPHGGTNTVHYGRLKAILDFYDPYVQQGKAAYSTFDDVSHLISTPAAPQESPFALQEVRFNVPEEAPALADLGAKTARLAPYGTLIWDLIETQKGIYDWTSTDRVLTAGWKTGTRLFVGVGAQNRLEGTTSPGPGGLPKDMRWYLTFLKKAVERYDGDGVDDAPGSPKIDVVQIGNEVDGAQFWQDTAQNYALLLKESYKAIKSVAPSIQVAIGGVATPWGYSSFYKPILAELERLKDASGDRFFDIFDLHWSGQFRGDDDYAAIQVDKAYELGAYVADVKADLAAIGYSDIPIYITEMSDYSDTPAGYLPHTERYHAAAVVKRYLYALSRGVSKIFWAGIIEQHNFGGDVNGYFDNVSLVNSPANGDGLSHKKLAYYTYKKMADLLDGSDWKSIQVIRESDDVHVNRLDRNGKRVFVAWWDGQTPGATKPVSLTGLSGNSAVVTEAVPSASSGLTVTDYATAFHSETISISGGTASFSLGESPVFVVVQ